MSKRNYRKRDISLSDNEDNDVISKIKDIVELQKIRKQSDSNIKQKLKGGQSDETEFELCDINDGALKPKTDEVTFNDGFAQETNCRTEDADMTKFIEEELAKRSGIVTENDSNKEKQNFDIIEDVLKTIPVHLRPELKQSKEDMVSNQMLCGIPEVDLGVEAKMKNIIATEEAKQKLMKDRWAAKQNDTTGFIKFVPKNIAVNFAEQTKNKDFLLGDKIKSCNTAPSAEQLEVEKGILKAEKSTDALKLEKLRNQQRSRKK